MDIRWTRARACTVSELPIDSVQMRFWSDKQVPVAPAEASFQEAQDMCNIVWGFGKAFAHIASRPGQDRRMDAYITFHLRAKPHREMVSTKFT